jgi:hypothetical protein
MVHEKTSKHREAFRVMDIEQRPSAGFSASPLAESPRPLRPGLFEGYDGSAPRQIEKK